MVGGRASIGFIAAKSLEDVNSDEIQKRPSVRQFDRDFFLSPFTIVIEYCTRSTFHTKHRPEKYAAYFQATKQAFQARYPNIAVVGNPEEHSRGRRPFSVTDHLQPLQDVSRPRLGSFEVTLLDDRMGPLTVFSKLESGRWPNPRALVDRAESVSRGEDMLPQVVEKGLWSKNLPGSRGLKVKRNLRLKEPRFQRSWDPPKPEPPQRVRDLRELSVRLYRRGGTMRELKKAKAETFFNGEDSADGLPQEHSGFTELLQELSFGHEASGGWEAGGVTTDSFSEARHMIDEWENCFEEDPQDPVSDDGVNARPPCVVPTSEPSMMVDQAAAPVEPQVPGGSRPSSRGNRPGNTARSYTAAGASDSRNTEGEQATAAPDTYSDFEDLSHEASRLEKAMASVETLSSSNSQKFRRAYSSYSDFEGSDLREKAAPQMVEKEFELQIERSGKQKFGMVVRPDDDGRSQVQSIRPGGTVDEWNSQDPPVRIDVGDHVMSVNGITEYSEIMQEFKSSRQVTIILAKLVEEALPRLSAASAPSSATFEEEVSAPDQSSATFESSSDEARPPAAPAGGRAVPLSAAEQSRASFEGNSGEARPSAAPARGRAVPAAAATSSTEGSLPKPDMRFPLPPTSAAAFAPPDQPPAPIAHDDFQGGWPFDDASQIAERSSKGFERSSKGFSKGPRAAPPEQGYDDEFAIPDSSSVEDTSYENFDREISGQSQQHTRGFPVQRSYLDSDDDGFDDEIAQRMLNAVGTNGASQDMFDSDDDPFPMPGRLRANGHGYASNTLELEGNSSLAESFDGIDADLYDDEGDDSESDPHYNAHGRPGYHIDVDSEESLS